MKETGATKGWKIFRCSKLSHLLFVGIILSARKEKIIECESFHKTFQIFHTASRLSINSEKSKLISYGGTH